MTRWLPLFALCCFMAPAVSAQSVAGSPVDPNVSDADPRATSLRRVEPGNAQFSYEARMRVTDFRAAWSQFTSPSVDPATGLRHHQQYQYSAPGVRALIDRPLYLVKTDEGVATNRQPSRDGSEIGLIPANTVFLLTLPAKSKPRPDVKPKQSLPSNMLNTRLDTRVSPLSLRDYQAQQQKLTSPQTNTSPAPAPEFMPHITDRHPAATQPASTD